MQDREIIEAYLSGLSAYKIAALYNCSPHQVYYILERNDIPRRSNKINSRRYKLNEHYFDDIDTEEKAYWLGFMAADGYVAEKPSEHFVGISVSDKDRQHLEKFKIALEADYPIKEYVVKQGFKPGVRYVRLCIRNEHLYNQLLKHGIVPHKTTELKFPTTIPEQLIRHFVRGYFDGNGSFAKSKGKDYTFKFNGTYDFLQGLLKVLNSNTKILKDTRANNYYVCFGGHYQVLRIGDWLYNESTIYLERKYERYLAYKQLMSS